MLDDPNILKHTFEANRWHFLNTQSRFDKDLYTSYSIYREINSKERARSYRNFDHFKRHSNSIKEVYLHNFEKRKQL